MSGKNSQFNDESWYEYCWKYFELMSDQRMKMIEFYITIELALIGGLFVLSSLTTPIRWAEYVDTSAIILFSIIFKGLDARSKAFIKICEDKMVSVEERYTGSTQIIKTINEHEFKGMQKISYSKWFNVSYFLLGLFGIVCIWLIKKGHI